MADYLWLLECDRSAAPHRSMYPLSWTVFTFILCQLGLQVIKWTVLLLLKIPPRHVSPASPRSPSSVCTLWFKVSVATFLTPAADECGSSTQRLQVSHTSLCTVKVKHPSEATITKSRSWARRGHMCVHLPFQLSDEAVWVCPWIETDKHSGPSGCQSGFSKSYSAHHQGRFFLCLFLFSNSKIFQQCEGWRRLISGQVICRSLCQAVWE